MWDEHSLKISAPEGITTVGGAGLLVEDAFFGEASAKTTSLCGGQGITSTYVMP